MKRDILKQQKKIINFWKIKKNKKEINNKKGKGINYDEQLKLYKEAKNILDKDTDDIRFFNVLSNIKEEELNIEYDRIKNSNDKNKEGLYTKMLEDIQKNK